MNNVILNDAQESVFSQIISHGSFYGLELSGRALKLAINATDYVAVSIEPITSSLYNFLVLRRKTLKQPEPGISLKHDPKLYHVRNKLLQVIQMGFFALPFTADIVEPLVTSTRIPSYVNEDTTLLRQYHIYSSGMQSEVLNWSFAGSGWLLFYELGVAKCLRKCIWPPLFNGFTFSGSGTGSIIAACLKFNVDLEEVERKLIALNISTSRRLLGPVGCLSESWERFLEDVIPEFQDCDYRLVVSLSRFPSFENILVNDFRDKSEMISCLLASSFMPVLFESPQLIRGKFYVNGAWTNRIPVMEDTLTISVSPFSRKGNICPHSLRYTAMQEVFPTDDEQVLLNMIDHGYSDAQSWLYRMYKAHVLPDKFFSPSFQKSVNAIE